MPFVPETVFSCRFFDFSAKMVVFLTELALLVEKKLALGVSGEAIKKKFLERSVSISREY